VLKLWPGWLAGGGGGQYLAGGGGGKYPAGGGGGGHVRDYPTAGDPPHGIMGVEPV
jgi:hypothetical protein